MTTFSPKVKKVKLTRDLRLSMGYSLSESPMEEMIYKK